MSRDLPSGVVTLLFTDIEGSTRLLHELGDGYGAELAEHRRIVRETCTAHDGVPAEQQRAAVLLDFALGHEQLPAWYAAIARPALERLEDGVPPEVLAAAREEAAGLTLEEAVRIARRAVPEPVGSAAGS